MSRGFALLLLTLLLLVGLAWAEADAAEPAEINVLHIDGAINPVVSGYIERGIDRAEKNGAVMVIIQLDTPGGLDSSMRDIVQRIVNAKLPVVVYVSPAGARAASAGVFITMAAHVAAMAPNTAIGAAHPVSIGPSGAEETSSTMEKKVLNDALAYIRSIAQFHGRNVEWAQAAVRESVSASAQEALELNIVDLIAPNLDSLLEQLDGRQVRLLNGSQVVLQTHGVEVRKLDMSTIERFLDAISDPNIAYILLSLAMLGLFVELANPGMVFPGVLGGIFLFLSLYSLGMLHANFAGLLLILLAFGLFFAEIFVASHGMLSAGGIGAFIFGSLLLFSGSSPVFRISPWLIGGLASGISIVFILIIAAAIRAHRRQVVTGREGLLGEVAVALTILDSEGTVLLEGERWKAELEEGRAEVGEKLVVTRTKGLKVWVKKTESEFQSEKILGNLKIN